GRIECMKGDRKMFSCPSCRRKFWYWVLDDVAQPKIKCYYCSAESYPNGEPPKPPAPAPAPPPAPSPATPASPAT
ncbi:MAG: hypothetical protein WCC53_14485, partial [Thermoanaerobaculia bacterium]